MAKIKNELIVFCGVDGSGKSTLISDLSKKLNETSVKHMVFHAHGYSVSKNSFAISDKLVKKFRPILFFLIPLAFADNVFTYYTKYKPLLKYKTLLCDRYFYDKLARLMFYGVCPKFLAKIYLYLLPKPSHTFILVSSAESIFNRKPEYSLAEIKKFLKIYSFISEAIKVPVLSTNVPLNQTKKQILEAISK